LDFPSPIYSFLECNCLAYCSESPFGVGGFLKSSNLSDAVNLQNSESSDHSSTNIQFSSSSVLSKNITYQSHRQSTYNVSLSTPYTFSLTVLTPMLPTNFLFTHPNSFSKLLTLIDLFVIPLRERIAEIIPVVDNISDETPDEKKQRYSLNFQLLYPKYNQLKNTDFKKWCTSGGWFTQYQQHKQEQMKRLKSRMYSLVPLSFPLLPPLQISPFQILNFSFFLSINNTLPISRSIPLLSSFELKV
jgi:hypothetical protein